MKHEDIIVDKMTPLEKKIWDNFNRIPKKEYPLKYIEICESLRPVLVENSNQDVPSYILKKILSSNTLSPKEALYVLHKLIVVDTTSGNVVNTLKLTIDYLKLAEDTNSIYDINRAKIGLSFIFNSLGAVNRAISVLESIDINSINYPNGNRNKAMINFNLAEYYLSLNNTPKCIEHLNRLSNFSEDEDINYINSILFFKNILFANLYIKENKKERAQEYLNNSNDLLKKIKKNYFSNLQTFYDIALENYNLKYDITKFSELNLKKYTQTSIKKTDSSHIFQAFETLFQYYYKTENFIEYNNLKKLYDSYIHNINNINNKVFTFYLIESAENTYITEKNKKLYANIGILIIFLIIISTVSYKKIKQLDRKAKIDELSKIGNRLAFNEKMDSVSKEKYFMLLFDIDNFKKINDTYGHDFGDNVLQKIGEVLRNIENKEISVFRIGGEEFAIILTHLNETFSIETCEHIRKSIECLKWKHPIFVTISGGFSLSSFNTYIECDKRLYKAKNSGKNMIIYQEIEDLD
ncbi:MAG: diguanylate cyclase domain-containing protein [Cetobacterium somerae]|uniref:GGDEF domain-containing protein n=1 Tax=Cetobacterium somerae TaxID=188913 RepID=UPI003F30EF57